MKDKENTGVLFKNIDKEGNQPDLTGHILVGETKKRLAGWTNKSDKGVVYISLQMSEFKPKSEQLKSASSPFTKYEPSETVTDKDVPF